ncbi:MAG: hypothetical protein Q9218_002077 [Villophora microphyllina]
MSDSLTVSFLGALQASLSVLLTIGVGVLASQFNILNQGTTKEISTLCIWAIAYALLSMLLGIILTRLLKLPSWLTPAMSFNNTTSLPLLLIQALDSTSILKSLLMSDSDTTSDALNRAKSYFLVCAIVSNSMTFSLGPRLLDNEEAPDTDQREGKNQPQAEDSPNGRHEESQDGPANGHANGEATENTSLLPNYIVRRGAEAQEIGYRKGKDVWDRLNPRTRSFLDLLYGFLNAPLIGAVIGAIIGLAPPLHKAFFNEPQQGGVFKAWLTSSIQNVGEIFAALQVVVVGVKLSKCLRKMKRGEQSGSIPWLPSTIVLLMRFVIWPCISISVIYLLATRTRVLPYDPILFFAMMLMPTGPPAMALSSLSDCNDSSDEEKMAISKFLIVAYMRVDEIDQTQISSAVTVSFAFTSGQMLKGCHVGTPVPPPKITEFANPSSIDKQNALWSTSSCTSPPSAVKSPNTPSPFSSSTPKPLVATFTCSLISNLFLPLWFYQSHNLAQNPTIQEILTHHPDDIRILAFAFSLGGAYQLAAFAQLYKYRTGGALPLEMTISDCGSGRMTHSVTADVIAALAFLYSPIPLRVKTVLRFIVKLLTTLYLVFLTLIGLGAWEKRRMDM